MSVPLHQPASPAPLVLHWRISQEPKHRISEAQRESMRQILRTDSKAQIEGLDWKYLPVVRVNGPNGEHRYALRKNGEATAITWKDPRNKRLAETWR